MPGGILDVPFFIDSETSMAVDAVLDGVIKGVTGFGLATVGIFGVACGCGIIWAGKRVVQYTKFEQKSTQAGSENESHPLSKTKRVFGKILGYGLIGLGVGVGIIGSGVTGFGVGTLTTVIATPLAPPLGPTIGIIAGVASSALGLYAIYSCLKA